MTWNYRIVEYADGTGVGLHEVYYDANGREKSMIAEPATFVGESPEDVRGALLMARVDATKRPVFGEPDNWA